ncbi:MAG: ribonuclease III [Patescibacteria group bacterium]|jgi:ribonuclease-3|nr:ribonuclease III [Patescibacteria group bacterium]
MSALKKLQESIGFTFKNKEILQQAMVHRSYLNEHPEFASGHNERLEFLGDAVLEIIVTEHLYLNYPNTPEGDLTNWRAALVNSKMLYVIAEELKLDDCLYLSKGEAKDKNKKSRHYILANAVEALIGAVYLDQGMSAAHTLVHRFIINKLPGILANKSYLDPKSRFQEQAQEKRGITPTYDIISESGPDHEKLFKVGLYLAEELIATGEGSSKQEAQVAAASNGLDKLNW